MSALLSTQDLARVSQLDFCDALKENTNEEEIEVHQFQMSPLVPQISLLCSSQLKIKFF